jgi:hypothetical protein
MQNVFMLIVIAPTQIHALTNTDAYTHMNRHRELDSQAYFIKLSGFDKPSYIFHLIKWQE